MRRALSLWFPAFSTDLIRRRWRQRNSNARPPGAAQDDRDRPRNTSNDDAPANATFILLTERASGRERVARRCPAAAAAGVAEGMDLAHARSLLPGRAATAAHVEAYRPDREASALRRLACWATRFSPDVAPDPPDGLLLDATGTERLYRGEANLIRGLFRATSRLGFKVRVAAAPTFACAWAVARFGAHDLAGVLPGRGREALVTLPVAALRPGAKVAEALAEIGILTIGHVLDLPRASLSVRFGAELSLRIEQALGLAIEHLEPVRPAPPPRVEMPFDGPTDHWESIEAAARQVLDELVVELTRRERGVRRLALELARPHPAGALPVSDRIEITLSRPNRNARHLWSLLRPRLEQVDLDDGIEGLTLTAWQTGRLRHEQVHHRALGGDCAGAAGQATTAAWGELVDTLVGRLGPEGVVRIEPVESHLPERAFRERPVMEEVPRRVSASTAAATGPTTSAIPADRPTRLLPRPESIDAISLSPDGPLLSLGWRGRRWRVVSCVGPERIAPEWWRWAAAKQGALPAKSKSPGKPGGAKLGRAKPGRRLGSVSPRPLPPPPPERDYFAAQLQDGRWLWVCRQVGTGWWFVHGEWS